MLLLRTQDRSWRCVTRVGNPHLSPCPCHARLTLGPILPAGGSPVLVECSFAVDLARVGLLARPGLRHSRFSTPQTPHLRGRTVFDSIVTGPSIAGPPSWGSHIDLPPRSSGPPWATPRPCCISRTLWAPHLRGRTVHVFMRHAHRVPPAR
jgi:hypothetical protein